MIAELRFISFSYITYINESMSCGNGFNAHCTNNVICVEENAVHPFTTKTICRMCVLQINGDNFLDKQIFSTLFHT